MIRQRKYPLALVLLCFVSLTGSDPLMAAQVLEQETSDDERTRAQVLRARREEKSNALTPETVHPWEARLRRWEESRFPRNWLIKGWHGFRPLFGGMMSGSGTVFGGGYIYGLGPQRVQAQANARFSTKGYTQFDGEVLYPPPQDKRRIELKLRVEARDLKAVNFFGLGNDSSRDTDTSFRLEDTLVGGYAWLNPRGLLSFGAEGAFYRAEADSGSDPPSVEDVFPLPEVPGAQDPETDYSVVGGWVEFDIREKWDDPNVGVVARITGRRWDDTDLNDFDFTRVIGEVKGYIPLGPKNRILALRLRGSRSTPDGGDVVPFYLMETLGGAKSIRGYDEFRFRDRSNLLVNLEYRWEVWTFADFTVFFDAGKVFADDDEFNFKGMHTGYGFGIRGHGPGGMTLRFDFAHSQEGFRLHISSGPSF